MDKFKRRKKASRGLAFDFESTQEFPRVLLKSHLEQKLWQDFYSIVAQWLLKQDAVTVK